MKLSEIEARLGRKPRRIKKKKQYYDSKDGDAIPSARFDISAYGDARRGSESLENRVLNSIYMRARHHKITPKQYKELLGWI